LIDNNQPLLLQNITQRKVDHISFTLYGALMNSNNSIYLTIIVPVYNTESFLPNCLDSICSQLDSYDSLIEIWVVNDGSTDNCIAIIEAFRKKYPRNINIINKVNGGLSDARNVALDKASGRYIWFVDSDDAIEAGAIGALMPVIASTNADYIFFNAYRVDVQGRVAGTFCHDCEDIGYETFNFTAKGVFKKFNKHMVWLRLFRREFINSLRFPIGITHEDIHFDLQLLSRNPQVLYLDGIYYRHFFDNPDSITNTMNPVKHRHVLWVYNDLYEKFSYCAELKPLLDEYIDIAILPLFARMYNLQLTNQSHYDKRSLFMEYAQLIKKLSMTRHNLCLPQCKSYIQNVIFNLIINKYTTSAYILSLIFTKAKTVYEILSIARRNVIKHIMLRS